MGVTSVEPHSKGMEDLSDSCESSPDLEPDHVSPVLQDLPWTPPSREVLDSAEIMAVPSRDDKDGPSKDTGCSGVSDESASLRRSKRKRKLPARFDNL